MIYLRSVLFLFGLCVFSLGISITIKVNHLGIHPWDVLSLALFEQLGLSIGAWNIIVGILLIFVSFILDLLYIKIGTFLNYIIIVFMFYYFLLLILFYHSTTYCID